MSRDDQRTSTVTTVNGVLHKTHTVDGLQVPPRQSQRRREHTMKTSQQRNEHDAFPLPPPAHAAFQSGTPSVAPTQTHLGPSIMLFSFEKYPSRSSRFRIDNRQPYAAR